MPAVMVFTATRRPMNGSRALKTTPMAPRPSSPRISYLPICFKDRTPNELELF